MSKADDVFWRQFGVVLILLTVFGFAMYFVANSIGGQAYAKMNRDPAAVATRIAPAGQSRIGDPAAQTQAQAPAASAAVAASTVQPEAPKSETAPASSDTGAADTGAADAAGRTVAATGAIDVAAGEAIYQSACFACHLSGVAEAPKLDDPAAWEPRLGQGMAGLLQSVTDGKGAMPPKGGFAHLTEDDLRNAIGFMLDQAGVSAGG